MFVFVSLFLPKAKRKKASAPEKPAKKQKSGETSKPSGSAKSDRNNDDNMFQVEFFSIFVLTALSEFINDQMIIHYPIFSRTAYQINKCMDM